MSVLFCESFDGITSAQFLRKWDELTSVTVSGVGRRGTNGLAAGSATIAGKNLPSDYTTAVFTGAAVSFSALPSSILSILNFMEAATVHVVICLTSTGRLQARNSSTSGTLLCESAPGVVQGGSYGYIEAKAVIHDSTGSVTIRYNGVQVASASNVDTRNGQTGVCNKIRISGLGGGISADIDDFYIGDTNGSNNDFLGDVRVDHLAPNAAGNYSQWTPSAGSNFQNVDETPGADDDTSYNETDVDNELDSYQHASLASLVVEDIKAVQVIVHAKKSDAGSRTLKVGIRSGTTDNLDSGTALGTGYAGYRRIFDTDPNTAAAWTKANVDAVESLVQVGAP